MAAQSSRTVEIRRVIGIDPGTRTLGWAVIEARGTAMKLVACGAIEGGSQERPARLARILNGLAVVIAKHRPAEAALEEVFVGRNSRTALVIGEGRGVALAALGQAGLSVAGYPARAIKRAVTGNGAASKEQVARMTTMQLGLARAPGTEDVTDACAVAITHLARFKT
jgi:crossover junction endodeoxyribonuclease RuvC